MMNLCIINKSRFFRPFIEEVKTKYDLHLLCLSNGNFEGLGKIREKELKEASHYLGFKSLEIIDDPGLQDGMQ